MADDKKRPDPKDLADLSQRISNIRAGASTLPTNSTRQLSDAEKISIERQQFSKRQVELGQNKPLPVQQIQPEIRRVSKPKLPLVDKVSDLASLALEKTQLKQPHSAVRQDQTLPGSSATPKPPVLATEKDLPKQAEPPQAQSPLAMPLAANTAVAVQGTIAKQNSPVAVQAPKLPGDATKQEVRTVAVEKSKTTSRQKNRTLFPLLSFITMVLIPTLLIAYYFNLIASDQYRVESNFSVRGSNITPFAELGLNALPGVGTQNNDSYVVTGYINSRQVILDIQKKHGIDLRKYYSRPSIDFLYRISPTLSLEEFEIYWKKMISVEFNSTTGNSTLVIYAFDKNDAKEISDLVLSVSQELVNNLSNDSRDRLIKTAQEAINASEKRLAITQANLTSLRNREQTVDPQQSVSLEGAVLSELRTQLAVLKTRERTMKGTLTSDSPSVRVIGRQINAIEQQIAEQLAKVGSGSSEPNSKVGVGNLSDVVSEYSQLYIELEFATASYKAALTSFETANLEAQKQQRYFATYVYPYTPDASIYPRRIIDTLLFGAALFLLWLIVYFIVRSVYDHAV